jgi:hypothetical protein
VRQQVLALLAFACLAAVQLAAAAHPVAIGRELLAARPFATAVNVTRNQFVQVRCLQSIARSSTYTDLHKTMSLTCLYTCH